MLEQTDQRLFKGTTAGILASVPTPFTGWTYAESTDDNTSYRWNSTTTSWELLGAIPSLASVLAAGNKSGPNDILLQAPQSLDTDSATALKLGTANANEVSIGRPLGDAGNLQVFINQGGVPFPIPPGTPSNAGIQYSTTFASRAQIRFNQFGNNAGVPGVSAFKSRGLTVGDIAGVVDGDTLVQISAAGVAPNPPNNSLPIAALIGVVVPVGGSVPGHNWVGSDFEIQLVPIEGPINGRKRVFKLTSHGIPCLREIPAVVAPSNGQAAGLVTLGAGGWVLVPNSYVTAGTRFTLTIQDGGTVPSGAIYVASRIPGTSFTIQSNSPLDIGVKVYYQLWDQTAL